MDDLGVSNGMVVFSTDGLNLYQTSAVTAAQVLPTQSVSDATLSNLISTGQATPVAVSYTAQFPWTQPIPVGA